MTNRIEVKESGVAGGGRKEYWYRFGGKEMAYVGNNNTITTDYVASINNRTASSPPAAASINDTDQGYDPINSFDSGSLASIDGYTVQSGDTLAGIAAQLWGDSSLWYKLAEANGLVGDETLVDGLPLIIPAGVTRNTNSAATFKPYDPNDVTGSTMPTAIKPKIKGDNCGIMLILAVVAIAIAVIVAPMAAQFLAPMFGGSATGAAAIAAGEMSAIGSAGAGTIAGAAAGAAVGGAAGSIVTQSIAVATQIQDKFSWNAVGMAALGSAVGVGVGAAIPGTDALSALSRGALSSVITQGIGVATGMQSQFSWTAVAAAGVSSYVGAKLGETIPTMSDQGARNLIIRTAADIADAATRTVLDGSDFGDNMLAALPDIVGMMLTTPMNVGAEPTSSEAANEC